MAETRKENTIEQLIGIHPTSEGITSNPTEQTNQIAEASRPHPKSTEVQTNMTIEDAFDEDDQTPIKDLRKASQAKRKPGPRNSSKTI